MYFFDFSNYFRIKATDWVSFSVLKRTFMLLKSPLRLTLKCFFHALQELLIITAMYSRVLTNCKCILSLKTLKSDKQVKKIWSYTIDLLTLLVFWKWVGINLLKIHSKKEGFGNWDSMYEYSHQNHKAFFFGLCIRYFLNIDVEWAQYAIYFVVILRYTKNKSFSGLKLQWSNLTQETTRNVNRSTRKLIQIANTWRFYLKKRAQHTN